MKSIGEYKKDTILTPIFVSLEVVLEVIIPLLMAKLIDEGIYDGEMSIVYKIGLELILCAIFSLLFDMLSGIIAENIRWGNENASDDEVKRVCKLAQADDFVMQFPDGYNTYIEEGGTNVSGGQKQRLCIARALLKHPKILILDDSTSAVDTKTDSLIQTAFKTESVAGSLFLQTLIDNYITPLLETENPVFTGLIKAIGVMAVIYIVGIITRYLYSRIMAVIAQGVLRNIRNEMFEKMEKLPIRYFDTHTHGDIMSIYTNDEDTLEQMISQGLPQAIIKRRIQ